MPKHFIYRHIRLDKNEPFYIGIGTKPPIYSTLKSEYVRAYISNGRNPHWKRIVDISEYEVEIIFESDDYEFIKDKEKEFIRIYGRRDKGLGSLVNLTDGGDGALGSPSPLKGRATTRLTKEGIAKMAATKKGKPLPESMHKAALIENSVPVYQYDGDKFLNKWDSIKQVCDSFGFCRYSFANYLDGKNKKQTHFYKGYNWYRYGN